MIQIKNKQGEVIHTVEAKTLVGANLCDADLCGANLSGANVSGASGLPIGLGEGA